jgi:hypothetical protein
VFALQPAAKWNGPPNRAALRSLDLGRRRATKPGATAGTGPGSGALRALASAFGDPPQSRNIMQQTRIKRPRWMPVCAGCQTRLRLAIATNPFATSERWCG